MILNWKGWGCFNCL